MERGDILIIGGGVAGIAAAKAAASLGCKVLLADRGREPGGVLLQCTHPGFGPDLTGPAYVASVLTDFPETVRYLPNTTVLSVSPDKTAALTGLATGRITVGFERLILATGCMEIPPGALDIAGTRPEGVYTAGQVQAMLNLYHQVPEGPAVILGSGDMGLLMAHALAEAGQTVAAVVEQRPRCGGMAKYRQWLKLHQIPLLLSATISETWGEEHLTGVTVRFLKTGEETWLPCATLVVAAGLRPDRELVRELSDPDWLHLCGNCRQVHPTVESVVQEGARTGRIAAEMIWGKQ